MRGFAIVLPLVASAALAGCSQKEQPAEKGADGAASLAPASAQAPVAPVRDAKAIGKLVAEADALRGEAAFKQNCSVCHAIKQGDGATFGPRLGDVVGRKPGSVAGFAYSVALTARRDPWTLADLDAFIERPQSAVPGTKMTFAGLADAGTRADLIKYLERHAK